MPAITFTTRGALNKSALRHANERLILNAIRRNPAVSRAEIVRMTGLSPSSVTFIVNRLMRDGMILEKKLNGRAQVGRQPIGLWLRGDARLAVGVDVTLSGARVVLGDWNDHIVGRKVVPWSANYHVFFDKVHSAIRSLIDPVALDKVLGAGVTLPGPIDRETGKVIAAENFNWFGVEAGALIRKDLKLPFYFENLAKASALAEMWASDRESRPLRDFVFVSTRGGLGTGVIINGQILQGTSSAASEFGHVSLDINGRRCPCGNVGCWEQYASDLALCRLYRERTLAAGAGGSEETDAAAIIARAGQGDKIALSVVEETAYHVGLGFINLIFALNPEAIIVGDYLAAGWSLMADTVWSVLRSRVPAYYLTGVRILPSKHGVDCSLMGAQALVLTRLFRSFDHPNLARPRASVSIHAAR